MKIFLKTLKGDKIEFEVQPEDTVLSLKQRVKEVQGHDVELQKLIATGRIMEDAKLLSEYSLKEGDNIVIMVAKPKPQPRAPVEPVSNPPPASVPAPVAGTQVAASPAPATTGPEFEAAVQRVMELGFPRDQVEAALRATRNNPDLAIDYLMGSVPMQEDDLEEGAEAGEPGENPFLFLQNHPAMAQIRAAIQQNPNPALIQSLVQQIAASNPELSQLINAYPREFMEFLLQPSGPQIDPRLISALPRPAGGNQIQLTREEVDAVKNLASLGFAEEDALEAYLSCDKNEAMAASLLFESYSSLGSQHAAPRPDPPPS